MIARAALTCLLVLFAAGPARAAGVESAWGGYDLDVGGDRVAWMSVQDQRWWLEVAASDAPPRTLLAGESGPCQDRPAYVLSATRIAVLAKTWRRSAEGHCTTGAAELHAGPPDGPLVRLESYAPEAEGCHPKPAAIALDGDRLAVLRGTCDGPEVVLYDLAAGGPPKVVARPRGVGPRIRLAGGFLAVELQAPMFQSVAGDVAVLDVASGAEVYRVALGQFEGVYGIELGRDGRVLVTTEDPDHRGFTMHVATPQQPAPRALAVPLCSRRFGYDGGDEVFVCRRDAGDLAVVDLAGNVRNVIARRGTVSQTLDFDGRRIAWTHADVYGLTIRHETYPYRAPTPPGPDPLGGGPGRQRALSSPLVSAAAPELAAANGRAMAVWLAGTSIMGRLVNANGVPVRPGVEVSQPAPPASLVVQPSIAAGPRGRWLATWTGAGADGANASVRVRLLDARGRPTGEERALPGVDGATYNTTPSVVGMRDGYVVAWESERPDGSSAALTARLDAAGRITGGPHAVRERPGGSRTMGAALVRVDGGAVLVWSEAPTGGRAAILAQRLDSAGRPEGAPRRLSDEGAPAADGVVAAHHAGAGRTLVVWRQGPVPFSGDVMAVVLGRDGRPMAAPRTVRGVLPDFRMDVAAAGRGFLVAGVGKDFLGGRDIYAVATGLDGRRQGKAFRVSRMGPDRTVWRPDGRAEDGGLPALTPMGRRRVLAGWAGNDDGKRKTRIWVRPLRVR